MRLVTADYDKRALSAQAPPSAVEEAGHARPSSPSGRLLLRMPSGLHGELARAAERHGTSLNGYIIARLAESVGSSVDEQPAVTSADRRERRTLMWLLVANVVGVVLAGFAAVAILLVAEL